MMTRLGLILMLALGVACGDDDVRSDDGGTGGNTDSGPITFDAGPQPDSGITLVDAGNGTDSGPDGTDSGPDGTDSGPGGTDAGPTPACATPPPPLAGEQIPRCAAATLECLMACGDQACFETCITDDTTPAITIQGQDVNCEACLNFQFTTCAATNGCQDEWGELQCCVADCDDQACADSCQMMFLPAFQTCARDVAASCAINAPPLVSCFASE